MSGLFATLNVGRSGMYTAQKSIDVTSHNIANANTEGYSKQRAKAVTNEPFTLPGSAGQLGTGATIEAVERIRDGFLDYQVRNETAVLGQYDTRYSYLSQIESIMSEPSTNGLSTLIGKFFDSWQELSKLPQSSNNRTVVAQQSLALTDALNHTYKRLNDLGKDAQSMIRNDVIDINSMLDQVNQLNQEIMSVKISKNSPNDLMDKRDLLLDQLSKKFNINIDKQNFEGINVKPVDIDGMTAPELVKADKNESYARFSYINSIEVGKDSSGKVEKDADGNIKKCTITYYALGDMSKEDNKRTLTIEGATEEQIKELTQSRVLWASKGGTAIKGDGAEIKDGSTIKYSELRAFKAQTGSLKGESSIQNDIDKYKDQLNKLAKSIAFTVNAIHSGTEDATKDKMPFFVNGSKIQYDKNGLYDGYGKDATNNPIDGESEITAENITINKEILNDVMKIKTRTHDDKYAIPADNKEDGPKDNARAYAIGELRKGLIKIQDIKDTTTRADIVKFVEQGTDPKLNIKNDINGMTLDGYFKDSIDKLGIQGQEARRMVNNQTYLLDDISNSREMVSGVSLDEEMANLVQYQHAYGANAKIISTVDQLLDVVVNGLKK